MGFSAESNIMSDPSVPTADDFTEGDDAIGD
jgi:hypothetical protein